MNCLLPVFPTGEADRRRLCAPLDDGPVWLRVVRSLAAHPDLEVLLATSEPEIAREAAAFVRAIVLPDAVSEIASEMAPDAPPLPPGTKACLAELLKQELDPDAPLMVLDCRHPFLDGRLVEQARAAWDGETPLLGMCKPEDHPVQIQALFQFRWADALLRLDPTETTDAAAAGIPGLEPLTQELTRGRESGLAAYLSRPMLMDWLRHGFTVPERYCAYALLRGTDPEGWTSLVPLEAVPQGLDDFFSVEAGFVLPTRESARRVVLLPQNEAPPALSFLGGRAPDCLGLDEDGATRIFLRADLCPKQGLLKVAPFAELRGLAEHAANIWLHDLSAAPRRAFGGAEYVALDATLPKDADGAVLSILEPCFNNTSNHTEPAFPATPLWSFDGLRKGCVNLQSGELIVGRQQFPEVYQICPAIALAHAKTLAELDSETSCAGLPLDSPYTHAFDQHLGQLRCLELVQRRRETSP